MKPEEFKDVIGFESRMRAGDEVEVHWTNCGNYYHAPARVLRVNAKSVVVEIMEPVEGYPKGHHITVPRLDDIRRWSMSNRVSALKAAGLGAKFAQLEKQEA